MCLFICVFPFVRSLRLPTSRGENRAWAQTINPALVHTVAVPALSRLNGRRRPRYHFNLNERVRGAGLSVSLARLGAGLCILATLIIVTVADCAAWADRTKTRKSCQRPF
jgi:hypothetical protein